MKDNRGISLTEIVVVMAIMIVLTGAGISFMGFIPRSQVKGCTNDLNIAVNKAKTDAMSFYSCKLTIRVESDGIYADMKKKEKPTDTVYKVTETKKVGESGVVLKAVLKDKTSSALTDSKTLSVGDFIDIGFIRSTGGFSTISGKITLGGGTIADDTYYLSDITVEKGKFSSKINFASLTGKTSVEN